MGGGYFMSYDLVEYHYIPYSFFLFILRSERFFAENWRLFYIFGAEDVHVGIHL